jgi:O-antigen/teichoic acid export membrane protein
VASIFLVRSLGSTGYGQYAFIYAFLSLFGWFAAFGTDSIIVRQATKSRAESYAIWSNGLLTQLLFSGVALVAMLVTAVVMGYEGEAVYLMLIAAMDVLLLIPWRLPSRVFQVEWQQWRGVLAILVRQCGWLLLLILFSRPPVSLTHLLWARTATALLEVGILWFLVRPFLRLRLRLEVPRIVGLLRYSWPLALSALSVAVYHRVDRVMIEQFLSPRDLGYYATAGNLASMMAIMPVAFMTSLYPLLCQRSDRQAAFERISAMSFRLLLITSVGLAGLLCLIGQPLVVLIYGEEFAYSGQILVVLGWAQVAVCYGVVISQILLSQNLQRYMTIATVAGAVTSILGNWLLLPRVGVMAAAWVTVASYSLAGILAFLIFPTTRNYSLHGFIILLRVLLVGGVSLALSLVTGLGDVISAMLFAGMFVLGLGLSRLLNRQDLHLLREAIPVFRFPMT